MLPLVMLLLAATPSHGRAAPSPSAYVTVGAVRSWSSPTSTRIVIDFSRTVAPVAPDSGAAAKLAVTVPGESVVLAAGVPSLLRVGDGVVDSLVTSAGANGARFSFSFRDMTGFRVFTLPAEGDKPFRLVVDVTRPGGVASQNARLVGIATQRKDDRVRIIAIDAGHGGDDMGAHGPRGVLEKNVNLGVA